MEQILERLAAKTAAAETAVEWYNETWS